MTALWRVRGDGAPRWARGPVDEGPQELLPADSSLAALLGEADGALAEALRGPGDGAVPAGSRVLAPVDRQDVWAAGVTYVRSRDARLEESTAPDHYDRVYVAERPELFFKASAERVRAPGEPVGVRADSAWDVPEPELGVVADSRGAVVGYVIGNDMSSRTIEGENPLYLPQAKIYTGSCAIGPCIVPLTEAPAVADMDIALTVRRDGASVYADVVQAAGMRRSPDDLMSWLFRALEFPAGVVLLTGTGLVPDPEFTLMAGDEVIITITGLGRLSNPVEVVGS